MAFNSLNTIDKDCVTVANKGRKEIKPWTSGPAARVAPAPGAAGGGSAPGRAGTAPGAPRPEAVPARQCYQSVLVQLGLLLFFFPFSFFLGYECWGSTCI